MLVIVNPAAGRNRGVRLMDAIVRRLESLGMAPDLQESRCPGGVRELVAEGLRTGRRRIVIAGGDGSLNEAVNGYVGKADGDQALGVIPIGTGNDFAKAAGVPRRWQDACDRLLHAVPRSFDAGCCNGRWFINGVGAGHDARIARAASQVRWIRGPLTYAVGLVRVLAEPHRLPRGTVDYDTGSYQGAITLTAVMNGRVQGGLFPIAPDADPADGLFHLVIGGDLSRRRIITLLPALLRGRHPGKPGVTYVTTRNVRVSFDTLVPLQIDGEVLEEPVRTLDVSLNAGAVRLLI